ncbi:hypothetical protein QBC32DRAFT_401901 [Pseudoneurospora amorphoporcata]|uniref:Uncharacterized protein n=1 Tax=Pseudoneurospora amorphoporcata TaxID=241081 RepID=A0AAN6NKP6_9PEZI|nr:hypothetical protein QBC32DRAFT_401901 [Pseudoneurospora amorphoporcata]
MVYRLLFTSVLLSLPLLLTRVHAEETSDSGASDRFIFPSSSLQPVYYTGDTLLVKYNLEQSGPVASSLALSLKCMAWPDVYDPAWNDAGATTVVNSRFCLHSLCFPDGNTLLVRYSLGHSRRAMKLVMSLQCMAKEDENPLSRSLVLSDDAMTVATLKNNVPSSAGTVPFTLPSVPQLQDVSEVEDTVAPVCAITLKGERIWDREPVSLQSEPFQLRASGGDGSQRQKTCAFEGVFEGVMPPNRGHPIITGNRTHGSAPTMPTPSVMTATMISTTDFPANTIDPTTSATPQPTSGTDKRGSEGLSKAAVAGTGVGAAVGVLLSREIHRKVNELGENPVNGLHGTGRPTPELPPAVERRDRTEERPGQQVEERAEEITYESVVEGRAELP